MHQHAQAQHIRVGLALVDGEAVSADTFDLAINSVRLDVDFGVHFGKALSSGQSSRLEFVIAPVVRAGSYRPR